MLKFPGFIKSPIIGDEKYKKQKKCQMEHKYFAFYYDTLYDTNLNHFVAENSKIFCPRELRIKKQFCKQENFGYSIWDIMNKQVGFAISNYTELRNVCLNAYDHIVIAYKLSKVFPEFEKEKLFFLQNFSKYHAIEESKDSIYKSFKGESFEGFFRVLFNGIDINSEKIPNLIDFLHPSILKYETAYLSKALYYFLGDNDCFPFFHTYTFECENTYGFNFFEISTNDNLFSKLSCLPISVLKQNPEKIINLGIEFIKHEYERMKDNEITNMIMYYILEFFKQNVFFDLFSFTNETCSNKMISLFQTRYLKIPDLETKLNVLDEYYDQVNRFIPVQFYQEILPNIDFFALDDKCCKIITSRKLYLYFVEGQLSSKYSEYFSFKKTSTDLESIYNRVSPIINNETKIEMLKIIYEKYEPHNKIVNIFRVFCRYFGKIEKYNAKTFGDVIKIMNFEDDRDFSNHF